MAYESNCFPDPFCNTARAASPSPDAAKLPDPYLCRLAGIPGLSGPQKIALTGVHTAQELFEMPELSLRGLCEYLQIRPEPLLTARAKDPREDKKLLEKQGLCLVTWLQAEYPRKLRRIENPPFALYYRGKLPPDQAAVAIVGARQCSEYGRETAAALGQLLAENQIPVISGMAYGIDSAGQAGALHKGGRTWAVLGCGADICYPSGSRALYEQIRASGGILSEFPPQTPPFPCNFPIRNRIISGLSDITVVVEAKLRSGSLITADYAMEQGREVYAVPGRICDERSRGTNRLLYQGAGILDDPVQFLKDHNLIKEEPADSSLPDPASLSEDEARMYACLDSDPKFLDVLLAESGMNIGSALKVLGSLRKTGLAKESYKNYFSRTFRADSR